MGWTGSGLNGAGVDTVTTDDIADGAVTAAKLADEAVTSAKLESSINATLAKTHTHSNATELDKIASGDVAVWNSAATKAPVSVSALPAASAALYGCIRLLNSDDGDLVYICRENASGAYEWLDISGGASIVD